MTKNVSDDTLDTLINWIDKLSASREHEISRSLYRDTHAALSELKDRRAKDEPTSEPVLSPMAPEDHLHARIESQRQEIERLKPPGRVNPNTAGPCPLCGRTDNHSHTAGPFGMS